MTSQNTKWLMLSIALAAGWQYRVSSQSRIARHLKYEEAESYSASVGKSLLVAGSPIGSSYFDPDTPAQPLHGWGDVCVDINPDTLKSAPPNCTTIVADVRNIPYPDKYFGAAFSSHLLEHLPTVESCEIAIAELNRVAEKVYVVTPSKQSISAWLVPDHHLWVSQKDGRFIIEQR